MEGMIGLEHILDLRAPEVLRYVDVGTIAGLEATCLTLRPVITGSNGGPRTLSIPWSAGSPIRHRLESALRRTPRPGEETPPDLPQDQPPANPCRLFLLPTPRQSPQNLPQNRPPADLWRWFLILDLTPPDGLRQLLCPESINAAESALLSYQQPQHYLGPPR